MSLSTYYLEDGRHLLRLHRRRRHRAYAPTSSTASHNNHEKINSWVSFSFLYWYGAPLGGLQAVGAPLKCLFVSDTMYCILMHFLKVYMTDFFICSIKSLQCADKCSETIFSIAIFLPRVLMCQKRQISLSVGYKTATSKTGDWERL